MYIYFNQASDDKGSPIDPLIVPDFVFTLEVGDEMIKERNMNLPESVVSGTKFSEEALVKRLEEYKSINTDENTVLNYFDEHEIHPIQLDIGKFLETSRTEFTTPTFIEAIDKIAEIASAKMGSPRNYGPSPQKLLEQKRARDESLIIQASAAEQERIHKEKEESDRHNKSVSEWVCFN